VALSFVPIIEPLRRAQNDRLTLFLAEMAEIREVVQDYSHKMNRDRAVRWNLQA
jgi:hypothetical protein